MKLNKHDVQSKEYIDLVEQDWHISRMSFVKTVLLSSVALQLPWLQSCGTNDKDFGDINPLTLEQFKTIREVQNCLFPQDGNGPGALQISADKYLLWVLRDPLLDPDENTYIIKRIKQFIAACQEKYNSNYFELTEFQKNEIINSISKTEWGEKFLSRILTLIFEALLLDPIYGGNTNQLGWKWLEHDPGNPRPNNEIIYPTILKKHEI